MNLYNYLSWAPIYGVQEILNSELLSDTLLQINHNSINKGA